MSVLQSPHQMELFAFVNIIDPVNAHFFQLLKGLFIHSVVLYFHGFHIERIFVQNVISWLSHFDQIFC
jgi:hypothetical protein